MKEKITGFYSDPKHGHCLRRIRNVSTKIRIDGVYGDDEPDTNGYWYAYIKIVGSSSNYYNLEVDFTGKPIKKKKILTAKWYPSERCIQWEDGNTWKKLYHNFKQIQ